jgi:hypothetical protein
VRRLLSDENFDMAIHRGLLLHCPDLDIVRVQDVGLSGQDDAAILEWAAQQGRIVLTSDVSTFSVYAYQRMNLGKPMPGVFVVPDHMPIGQAIEEILVLAQVRTDEPWEDPVVIFPL